MECSEDFQKFLKLEFNPLEEEILYSSLNLWITQEFSAGKLWKRKFDDSHGLKIPMKQWEKFRAAPTLQLILALNNEFAQECFLLT